MLLKRSGITLVVFWLLLIALLFRLYYVAFGDIKVKVYETAGSRTAGAVLYNSKGVIYDKNLVPLAGNQFVYYLIVDPRQFDITQLERLCELSGEDSEYVAALLKKETPIILESYSDPGDIAGVYVYEGTGRYPESRVAEHVIGYLDSEGVIGLSGIEKAYNSLLSEYSNKVSFSYTANAVRGVTPQTDISFKGGDDTLNGIVLTLDKRICEAAQNSLSSYVDKGCVIVSDCNTGDILALSSLPSYDADSISDYTDSSNGELINNALVNQSVGSVFKILISACALENGLGQFSYLCKGATSVNGRRFTCQGVTEHGQQDMATAFSNSCNCYFISLGQLLGFEKIVDMAQAMGLDSSIRLAKDIYSEAGVLPTEGGSLDLANLSIGQGKLLLPPLSVMRLTAVVANGGYLINPVIYSGTYIDGSVSYKSEYSYKNRVISQATADALKEMCIQCVDEGTGRSAKPAAGGAGGKTASAQTGVRDENGKERLDTCFTGFYPADEPDYVITVFAVGGESGAATCAPVFREICDFIGQNY